MEVWRKARVLGYVRKKRLVIKFLGPKRRLEKLDVANAKNISPEVGFNFAERDAEFRSRGSKLSVNSHTYETRAIRLSTGCLGQSGTNRLEEPGRDQTRSDETRRG